MIANIVKKFRRETTSGLFMPEIDGIRFLAIFMVVVFHTQTFYLAKTDLSFGDLGHNLFFGLTNNGFKGVEIFFVLSGFILALPFAKHRLKDGKKPILKNFYLRRLTRLEPPYFIALVIFFGLHLIKGIYPADELLKNLLYSLAYISHFVRDAGQPVLGNLTWSLEVEVQFYIIAPLLMLIFKLKKKPRRLLLLTGIFGLPVLNYIFSSDIVWLYGYLHYFLAGLLIADLYLTEKFSPLRPRISILVGLSAFLIFIYLDISLILNKILFLLSIFVIFYLILNDQFWRKSFSNRILTTIGGMCYTIYIFHTVVISGIGNATANWFFTDIYALNFLAQFFIFSLPILLVSGVYYIIIEKPCMNKQWPINLLVFVKSNIWRKS